MKELLSRIGRVNDELNRLAEEANTRIRSVEEQLREISCGCVVELQDEGISFRKGPIPGGSPGWGIFVWDGNEWVHALSRKRAARIEVVTLLPALLTAIGDKLEAQVHSSRALLEGGGET